MPNLRKVFVALFIGVALTLLSATPAAAHGKLKLTVAGDGAGGVTVQAVHTDGHRLEKPVLLTLTGTGPDGQRVGPVQLAPAPEGQGFYSSGPLLSPGRWRVTVAAPAPDESEVSAEVQARPAQSPAPAVPAAATAPAADASATAGAGGAWWWPVGLAVLVIAALAVAVPMLLTRRRSDE
ncbi:hypothetical protein D7147_31595 [Micromonospora musae]|uniref:Copper resistance protein CopC n=1 Tax=Micromonospora musae TaxID=1894970 RepID=A0A3A9XP31_9ACTN|nr:hypothetical protein [Micromonospora musae]RKN13404.1 hypothetical protein D7147_31595 [Micromonospora musae]RKN26995.1 hypothetical protein D7044_29700 [Micromonospora musae]